VLILLDFHLVREAGPALLKTIEEPPASTVFVILADYVPPELLTIASRCVRIDFAPLSESVIAQTLSRQGVDEKLAHELAKAADGRLDRARLLAADPEFATRRRTWQEIPARLDGHGVTAVSIAGELVELLERSVTPLRRRHEEELAELEERNARMNEINGRLSGGSRVSKAGFKDLEERQRREVRRQRTDELKAGLAALAGVYRDRLAAGGPGTPDALAAVELVQQLYTNLAYNPNELLQLQALLVRLGRSPTGSGSPG
jgi:DNA polymerase-3 subunit delta'